MSQQHPLAGTVKSRIAAGTVLCLLALPGLGQSATETTATAWQLTELRIVDDAGNPVSNAEAAMVKSDNSTIGFHLKPADKNGNIVFSQADYFYNRAKEASKGRYDVLVLAKGKAPAIAKWDQPTSSPLSVTVKAGKPVELQIRSEDGRQLPKDLTPIIYPAKFGMAMQPKGEEFAAHSDWPEHTGAGTFKITLAETTQPLVLMVQDPNFLTGYSTLLETTSTLKTGHAAVELPAPAQIAVNVNTTGKHVKMNDQPQGIPSGKSLTFTINKLINVGEENRFYAGVASHVAPLDKTGASFTVDNIAPGNYYASLTEATPEELMMSTAEKTPRYREGKSLKVASAEMTSATFTYKQFDPAYLKGNGVANVTVKKQDGSAAAGMAVRLRNYLLDFGSYYTVTTGTLDQNGSATFRGLAAVDRFSPAYELTKDEDYASRIGSIALRDGKTSKSFAFTIPPGADDPAPDITLYDIHTSEPVTLSSLRGKVVFLDFWATWCGPCQAPMAHNQKVMEENGKRWGDKVAIIGASIDDERQTVVDHVKKNGWESVHHLWCGDGAFGSGPGKTYSIDGVPTAFLIDQQGKIIWRGHPSGYELVEEIDKLLAEK